jgi:hypothetical protein
VATFLAVTIALSFFYVGGTTTNPGTYLGVAYYALPFMLVSSGFGGYTAYAISRGV